MVDPTIIDVLKLISGIGWTIAYLVLIRKGFSEKTYGMPMFALFFNISWKFIFSFIMPFIHGINSSLQLAINIIWFICDVLILCTYFLYGKKYFPKSIDGK